MCLKEMAGTKESTRWPVAGCISCNVSERGWAGKEGMEAGERGGEGPEEGNAPCILGSFFTQPLNMDVRRLGACVLHTRA